MLFCGNVEIALFNNKSAAMYNFFWNLCSFDLNKAHAVQ